MFQILQEGLEDFSISAEKEVLHKMEEFCLTYDLEPDDVVTNWIAFATTKGIDKEPTMDLLSQFEKEKLTKLNKKGKKVKTPIIYDSTSIDHFNDQCHPGAVTPENRKKTHYAQSPSVLMSPTSFSPLRAATPSAKYSNRKASGDVVFTFGSSDTFSWNAIKHFSCPISPYNEESMVKEIYKFMFVKLRNYAFVLNDMIENASMKYKDTYDITEWSPVHLPSVDIVPVIGRVCSEDGGKLNINTLILEGCDSISSGHIIPLDVSELESFSLFPGQIIAGTGINSLGKKLIMKELYQPVSLPLPQNKDFPKDELIIVMAAGPFTTADSISYEPLMDLLKYLKSSKPHLLFLFGPFVDVKHEEIQNGELPETFEDMFQELITLIMKDLEDVSVVLIPSIRDIHHVPIYPTPPYDLKTNFKNLYRASDPCILDINGIVIALTATDILFHLGKEEIHRSSQSSDRLGRLCKHLLNQANFYPSYPPSDDVSIDYEHYEIQCMLPVKPHILVVPSDLRYFVKDVNGCCCVNPERLAKGCVGGTFARMKIKPIDSEKLKDSVIDYIYAEIMKI